MTEPALGVVVVTWNSEETLPGLLDSLPEAMDGLAWDLVLVDNASGDGTLDVVSELAPAAQVLCTGHNAGYAAGVNAGCRKHSDKDAVLLVNPDVRLAAGAVQELVKALSSPSTGIAVPKVLEPDGSLSFTLRREPSVRRAFGEAVLGGERAGHFAGFGEMIMDPNRYRSPGTADWAGGAVMLISRGCLNAVGEWDESLWLYSEETEFSLRARDAGFELRYVPSAVATHLGGDSHENPDLWTTLTLNRLRLFRRRNGQLRAIGFWAALVVNEALRSLAGRRTSRRALVTLLALPWRSAANRREPTSPSAREASGHPVT